jgi:YHS domain-containing protein
MLEVRGGLYEAHDARCTSEANEGIDNNQERQMTTKVSKGATTDPMCGMTVDPNTALHAERDGQTFYFCSDHCRKEWLATPAGAKSKDKSKGCCG